jgi:hypothetical protein
MYVTRYPIEEGRQPLVSRLRLLGLSFGILSTVMGCAVTPPPMAPLRATLAPVAPSAIAPPVPPPVDVPPFDVPPIVLPPPPIHPPYSAGGRTSDSYKSSPYKGSTDYERKMDEEERDYRQWRGAQEQEQERRSQQWEQQRAWERDPRYEWMR